MPGVSFFLLELNKFNPWAILQPEMKIKAVAFDLDGTLYPSHRLLYKFSLPALKNSRFYLHFSRVRKIIRTLRPVVDFHTCQAELLAERLGITCEEAKIRIRNLVYREMENRFARVRPFPYVEQTLRALKSAGYKLAVLSDFPVTGKLEGLGLQDYWDCLLSSEQTHYLKPNPEPFAALAACLKLRPAEILYIGDKYRYDICGAHAAGMLTAHLSRRQTPGSEANFTFSSYKNFASLLMERIVDNQDIAR
jgi:putative hydrolase of the HAD superfamily